MPCYDGQERESRSVRTEYVNGVDPAPLLQKIKGYQNQIQSYQNEVRKLEAGLCAVFSELEKLGIVDEIAAKASKNGQIDLSAFWKQHRVEDEERLAKKFKEFSEHERELLKKMMNDGRI